MAMVKKTPVGIENFRDIRKQGFYYIDKTGLIEQVLLNWGKVNLFTRPRRFGKTLNMSMLKSFLRSARMHHCLTDYIFPKIKNCVKNIWENIL